MKTEQSLYDALLVLTESHVNTAPCSPSNKHLNEKKNVFLTDNILNPFINDGQTVGKIGKTGLSERNRLPPVSPPSKLGK